MAQGQLDQASRGDDSEKDLDTGKTYGRRRKNEEQGKQEGNRKDQVQRVERAEGRGVSTQENGWPHG